MKRQRQREREIQLVLKKEISKQLSKKIFRESLYNFLLQLKKAIMSTNNSREILACRRQVLSREQREGKRQRARVNTRRASEDENNDMMTESVVLMSLWPRAINILISN